MGNTLRMVRQPHQRRLSERMRLPAWRPADAAHLFCQTCTRINLIHPSSMAEVTTDQAKSIIEHYRGASVRIAAVEPFVVGGFE